MTVGDGTADATEIELLLQQLAQRRVVEQRFRRRQQPAAREHGEQPMQTGAQHAGGVGTKHLPDLEIAPDALEVADRDAEAIGMNGDCRGIHGARRGAGDHRKRIDGTRRQQIRERPQDAHLIGGPRAASR
jgi:hypothetical protein